MPHLVDVAKTLLKRYRAFGWICWRALGRVELPTNGLGILQLYVLENTSTDKGHNQHNMASVAGYQAN